MLVTLPFVLLLLDFWPLKRFQWQYDIQVKLDKAKGDALKRRKYRIILEKIPLFLLVVGSCIITFFAQKSKGAVKAIWALPMKYRIENALVSYVKYVLKAIWPQKLAIFYPHPGNTLPSWQIVVAALLIVAACYGAIRTAKKYPYILVGLFCYLGTLVPVIGLVQVGNQAMADRYTYIPLIGIFIIVAWGVSDLFKRLRIRRRMKSEVRRSEVGSPVFALRATPGKQRSEILSGVTRPFNKRRFQKYFWEYLPE